MICISMNMVSSAQRTVQCLAPKSAGYPVGQETCLFLLFLAFGDDIVRLSYFFRAFSGHLSRNRVILSSYQQYLPSWI